MQLPPTRRLQLEEGGARRSLEVTAEGLFIAPTPSGVSVLSQPTADALLNLRVTQEGILVTPARPGASVNGEALVGPRVLGRYDLLQLAGALLRSEEGGLDDTRTEASAVTPGPASAAGPAPGIGQVFAGRYRLEARLGEGGFGVVYRAFDTQLERTVAIKVLLRAEGRALERFGREIRATAALQHPNLVTVHDSGVAAGRPYLVMELVEGRTLADAAQAGMTPTQAATVVRDATLGLAYAHGQGLLHRDIKPQNILVGADGRAVVLDFGLVRALEGDAETEQRITRTGVRLGTLPYMSPEQAFASELDERSEVYSLGASLYHALAGTYPFEEQGDDILVGIVGVEPRPPREANPAVPPDLEAITLKCMEKRAEDRYPTAAALAADLQRFLDGEPTDARPLTRWQRRLRLARRNRVLAAAVLGTVVVGLASLIFAGVNAAYTLSRIREERDLAEAARIKAEEARAEAESERVRAAEAAERATSARRRAEAESAAKDRLLAVALAEKGERLLASRRHEHAAALFARSLELVDSAQGRTGFARALAGSHDRGWVSGGRMPRTVSYTDDGRMVCGSQRGVVWRFGVDGKRHEEVGRQPSPVLAAAGHGEDVVTGGADGRVRFWRPGEKEPQVFEGHTDWVTGVAFSPDGEELASVSVDGTVRCWDRAGTSLRVLQTSGRLLCVAYDPEGEWLAAGGEKGTVLASRVGDGATRELESGSWTTGVAFQDGQLVTAGIEGELRRWSPTSGARHPGIAVGKPLTALAVGPEGQVAVGTRDGRMLVFDADGSRRYRDEEHAGWVQALAWSPRRPMLVSVGPEAVRGHSLRSRTSTHLPLREMLSALDVDPSGRLALVGNELGTVEVWDLERRRVLNVLQRAGPAIEDVVFGIAATVAAWGDSRGGVTLYRVQERRALRLKAHAKPIRGVAFDPQAKTLVSADLDGRVVFWSVADGSELGRLELGHPVRCMAPAVKRGLIALGTTQATRLVRLSDRKLLESGYPGNARAVALDPSGKWLAVALAGEVRVWSLTQRSLPLRLLGHDGDVTSLAFSADVGRLVTGSKDRTVGVWDVRQGSLVARLDGHTDMVTGVAIDAAGGRAVSTSWDGTLRTWSLATDRAPYSMGMGGGAIWDLTFDADGRLLGGGRDGFLYGWRPGEREAQKLVEHGVAVKALAASPDGELLATGGDGQRAAIRVWDARSGALRSTLRGHGRGVSALTFTNGGALVSSGMDRRIVVWDPEQGEAVREWTLPKEEEHASSLIFDPRGRLVTGATGVLRIWDLEGRARGAVSLPTGLNAMGLDVHPSRPLLASAAQGMRVRETNLRNPDPDRTAKGRGISLVGETQLHDLDGGEVTRLRRHHGFSFDVEFSPDGRFVAEAGGGLILYEVEDGRVFAHLLPPDDEIGRMAVVFGPRGRLLAAPSTQGRVMVWNLEHLGLLWSPAQAVERTQAITGLGVVGTEVVEVGHVFELDLRRAAAGE